MQIYDRDDTYNQIDLLRYLRILTLWASLPHAELALNGVEVFKNASGSHHQLRKLDLRLRAYIAATHTRGGVYMYSNHQACDGGRLYY
ncbi:Glutamine-dependent NAD(+) synthetase, partial [Thalictrum thalictroides]